MNRKSRQVFYDSEIKSITDFLVVNIDSIPPGKEAFQKYIEANPSCQRDAKTLYQKFYKELPKMVAEDGRYSHSSAVIAAVLKKVLDN